MGVTGHIGGGVIAGDLAPAGAPLRAGRAVAQLRVAHAERGAPHAGTPRAEGVGLHAQALHVQLDARPGCWLHWVT